MTTTYALVYKEATDSVSIEFDSFFILGAF